MPDAKEPVPIRPAATILLLRNEPAFEVLMVKRHHQIDFASGALVFPGGKTHHSDHDAGWERHATGWDSIDPDERPLRIAAIREVFEEAGVLLARDGAGDVFHGDDRCGHAREAVTKEERTFIGFVDELGVKIDLAALTTYARWVTPAMMHKRFDTWFYLAEATSRQLAVSDGWETVDAEWIAPAEALRLAAAGERTVIFPTRMNLQMLAEASSVADAIARAKARELVVVEPKVSERDGERVLVIPANAGYGDVVEPMAAIRG